MLCLSAALGALVSLVVRFRRGERIVRQQLKWVGLAGVCLRLLLPVAIVLWGSSLLVRVTTPLMLVDMALALGAAVLRYRLFDVDLIIGRSLAYAGVTVLAVGGLRGISVVSAPSSEGRRPRAGGRRDAGGGSGLPARFCDPSGGPGPALRPGRPLGARMRVDAFLEAPAFGHRAARPDPGRAVRGAARSAAAAVALPAGLRGFADLRGRPAELDPDLAVGPGRRAGHAGGRRAVHRHGSRTRAARVRQLVEHGRLALQMARLGVELNRQLDELDRSRARIAEAADEERRRIQRDLHDGAQQRLVTVGIAAARGSRAGCGTPAARGRRPARRRGRATSPRRSRSSAT